MHIVRNKLIVSSNNLDSFKQICSEEQRLWVSGGKKGEVLGFWESERLRRRATSLFFILHMIQLLIADNKSQANTHISHINYLLLELIALKHQPRHFELIKRDD
jgi:hypothetical protein